MKSIILISVGALMLFIAPFYGHFVGYYLAPDAKTVSGYEAFAGMTTVLTGFGLIAFGFSVYAANLKKTQ